MNHSMLSASLIVLLSFLAPQALAFQPSNRASSIGIRSSSRLLAASQDVIELKDSNFRKYFSSDTPILIDACADFCGPCKLIEPVINQCASDRKDSLVVSRYDVESDSNEIKLELLLQRVMPQALPSLILIKNNKVLGTRTGLISGDELNEFLDSNLSKSSPKQGIEEENEEKARRIKRKGFVSFMYQMDDYILKGDELL